MPLDQQAAGRSLCWLERLIDPHYQGKVGYCHPTKPRKKHIQSPEDSLGHFLVLSHTVVMVSEKPWQPSKYWVTKGSNPMEMKGWLIYQVNKTPVLFLMHSILSSLCFQLSDEWGIAGRKRTDPWPLSLPFCNSIICSTNGRIIHKKGCGRVPVSLRTPLPLDAF